MNKPNQAQDETGLLQKQFKLAPADVAKLERMAQRIAGGNTTNVIRQLIRQADETKINPVYEFQMPHPK